jgi:hypothetical protein
MSGHELDDHTAHQLSPLAALSPDMVRAARVRARCRAQLARRAGPATTAPPVDRRLVAPVIVLALCAVYVYSLVSTAVHLTRLL